jgi:shikimate dehydrogenase
MLERIMRFLVGLIGSGIGASRSPALHEREGSELGLHVHYQLIDLTRTSLAGQALPELLRAAEMTGFAGVNVTHPCKQTVIPYLDELSAEARAIGAVNTVVFMEGRRIGHNTDWYGFSESFRRSLPGASLESVLLLGAGGAGSAVAHAALQLGVKHLTIFDQAQERAESLAVKLRSQSAHASVSVACDLAEEMQTATGLIHATPIGMASHPGMVFAPERLRPDLWVSDIVYFPLETELLREARQRGCRTLDGGGMAVFQAARAFELFTGVAPDPERMLDHFSKMTMASA